MTKPNPLDPGEAFREMVTQWERNFNSLANLVMSTEGFARSMNQVQDVQLRAQKAFRDFMTHQLSMANMPTQDDVARLAESIQDLDRRMARIEELLEAMRHEVEDATPPVRRGPPRTRKPPSAAVEMTPDPDRGRGTRESAT